MPGEQRDRNDAAHEKGPSERVDNLHNAKRGRGSTSKPAARLLVRKECQHNVASTRTTRL